MDLTIAHYCKPKLSRLFVTFAQAQSGDTDEHIIFLEIYKASLGTFRRINHVRLSVSVVNFEASIGRTGSDGIDFTSSWLFPTIRCESDNKRDRFFFQSSCEVCNSSVKYLLMFPE